jgi:hypothetical protein
MPQGDFAPRSTLNSALRFQLARVLQLWCVVPRTYYAAVQDSQEHLVSACMLIATHVHRKSLIGEKSIEVRCAGHDCIRMHQHYCFELLADFSCRVNASLNDSSWPGVGEILVFIAGSCRANSPATSRPSAGR